TRPTLERASGEQKSEILWGAEPSLNEEDINEVPLVSFQSIRLFRGEVRQRPVMSALIVQGPTAA
ncbi:hypothetical protein E4U37_003957, partial [Claviceps purpurea]